MSAEIRSLNSNHSSVSIDSNSINDDSISIHSSISGDMALDDHRNQNNNALPIKINSRLEIENENENENESNNNSNNYPEFDKLNNNNNNNPIPFSKSLPKKPDQMLDSNDLRKKMNINDDDDSDNENEQFQFKIPKFGSNINKNDEIKKIKSKFNDNNNDLSKQISRNSQHSRRRSIPFPFPNNNNDDNSGDNDDIVSHGSRISQETEEDVCFPMLPEHVRVNGIDFDEIEEFIEEQREENEILLKRERDIELNNNNNNNTNSKINKSTLRYTPKNLLFNNNHHSKNENEKENIEGIFGFNKNGENSSDLSSTNSIIGSESIGVTFGNEKINKIENGSNNINTTTTTNILNDSTTNDSIHNYNQFQNNYTPPDRFSFFLSNNEDTFHAPDIPSLVPKGQKFQSLFQNDQVWWLDCTCPTDSEMKMLARAFGIHPLTAEDIRMQEAREKVELFKNYYFVSFHTFETDNESEDFLEPINVYIVVFRQGILTFHFAPIDHPANVRRRVRQLRDYVDVSSDWLCYALIDDITDGFAPIIQAIEYEADSIEDSVFDTRNTDIGGMLHRIGQSRRKVMTVMRLLSGKADVIKMFAKRCQDEAIRSQVPNMASQPRGDIALYLGDIQDHIITMFQSLLSYEKIFSRSHSNYLAQLQVESFYSNNQVFDLLSKVTLIGTILVPLNVVTGMFGMNVEVPGQNVENTNWWFGIMGFLIFVVTMAVIGSNIYLRYLTGKSTGIDYSGTGKSLKSFAFGRKNRNRNRFGGSTSMNASFKNGGNGGRSMVSLPSKYSRYGEY
ncbi:hypothetical protein B5S32_g1918 [[Candida] boidinii]|nr:hypothetical protein B5S32_g1918 [[Candida] boidinii]